MLPAVRKTTAAVAALGALALGGSAIAGAADKTAAPGGGYGSPPQNRPQRDALSGGVAAKVKAAALKKVPGATVLRTEGGGPYSTPYHAHIRTSGGDKKVVLVNSSFEATAVQADKGRARGRGGPGPAVRAVTRSR